MQLKSVKYKKKNKRNIKYIKKNKKNITKKLVGGNLITNTLDKIRNYVKKNIINILLNGQDETVKKIILNEILNSDKFKKIDRKIDIFIDRVDTLIQKFIQTTITTIIKVISAPIPGLSIIGAIINTCINWSILMLKSLSRLHDLYDIYSELHNSISHVPGVKNNNMLSKIQDLQSDTINKISKNQMNNVLHNYGINPSNVSNKLTQGISGITQETVNAAKTGNINGIIQHANHLSQHGKKFGQELGKAATQSLPLTSQALTQVSKQTAKHRAK